MLSSCKGLPKHSPSSNVGKFAPQSRNSCGFGRFYLERSKFNPISEFTVASFLSLCFWFLEFLYHVSPILKILKENACLRSHYLPCSWEMVVIPNIDRVYPINRFLNNNGVGTGVGTRVHSILNLEGRVWRIIYTLLPKLKKIEKLSSKWVKCHLEGVQTRDFWRFTCFFSSITSTFKGKNFSFFYFQLKF